MPWQGGTFDVVTAFNALFFARDPDEATMLRGFLSVGSYQRIIESEGEEKVVQKIKAAVEPFQTPDGAYRFSNKYLMSLFRRNGQAARTS